MAVLELTPINPKAKGSYEEQDAIFGLQEQIADANEVIQKHQARRVALLGQIAGLAEDAPERAALEAELGGVVAEIGRVQVGLVKLYRRAGNLVKSRLRMSDGSDPAEAIKQLSIDDFQEMLKQLGRLAEAVGDVAVPPTSANG